MVLLGRALLGLALSLAVLSCAPANERPVRGAVPGTAGPTPAGVPPTLTASDALGARPSAAPSPGPDSQSPEAGPSPVPSPAVAAPSAVASPSAAAAPPIVRTIAPSANAHVPSGAPVTLSAVLIGRGADLASASLSVNGADAGAQIDKRSPREWAIHTSQSLGAGPQTARVLVHDASGAAGGFTWQFVVGEDSPPAEATAAPNAIGNSSPEPGSR